MIYLSARTNELKGRRVQQELTGEETGEWIILDSLKPGVESTLGIVVPDTGIGTVEFTAESEAEVIAETAEGVPWVKGNVSETTYAYLPSGMTAIRFKSISGTIKGVYAI